MSPLILLHGALGSSAGFEPLAAVLNDHFELHMPDFTGHGAAPMPDAPFSIPLFAKQLSGYMEDHQLQGAPVFGYSMGGYVALYLAREAPGRIGKIVTLATKLRWDEATAQRETAMLDPVKMEAKVPRLARALQERHPGKDWREVVTKTAAMLSGMGVAPPLKEEDFAAMEIPVRLLLGDRDKMVSLEETLTVYKALPQGQLGMLPGTPHPLEGADPALLAGMIRRFVPSL